MSLASVLGSRTRVARSLRPQAALGALWACLGLLGGCFDSDEKYQPAAGSTSTTGPIGSTSDSTSTSGSSSTTAEPEETCRDAIKCVFGCLTELQTSMLPEPDLTCFIECEPGLNSQEVLDLFHLAECVTNQCIDQGYCDVLIPVESSSGSSSSSSGDSSSSGSDTGSSSTTGDSPTTICLNCVVGGIQDPEPPGCMEVAAQCQ